MGTLSENQAQEHREEEDRQRREDLGAAAAGEESAQEAQGRSEAGGARTCAAVVARERRRATPRLEGLGPVRRWQPGRAPAMPGRRLEPVAGSILHSSRTPATAEPQAALTAEP